MKQSLSPNLCLAALPLRLARKLPGGKQVSARTDNDGSYLLASGHAAPTLFFFFFISQHPNFPTQATYSHNGFW